MLILNYREQTHMLLKFIFMLRGQRQHSEYVAAHKLACMYVYMGRNAYVRVCIYV